MDFSPSPEPASPQTPWQSPTSQDFYSASEGESIKSYSTAPQPPPLYPIQNCTYAYSFSVSEHDVDADSNNATFDSGSECQDSTYQDALSLDMEMDKSDPVPVFPEPIVVTVTGLDNEHEEQTGISMSNISLSGSPTINALEEEDIILNNNGIYDIGGQGSPSPKPTVLTATNLDLDDENSKKNATGYISQEIWDNNKTVTDGFLDALSLISKDFWVPEPKPESPFKQVESQTDGANSTSAFNPNELSESPVPSIIKLCPPIQEDTNGKSNEYILGLPTPYSKDEFMFEDELEYASADVKAIIQSFDEDSLNEGASTLKRNSTKSKVQMKNGLKSLGPFPKKLQQVHSVQKNAQPNPKKIHRKHSTVRKSVPVPSNPSHPLPSISNTGKRIKLELHLDYDDGGSITNVSIGKHEVIDLLNQTKEGQGSVNGPLPKLRRITDKTKKGTCPICGKPGFKSQQSRYYHMQSHNNIICSFHGCGKRFTRFSTLKQHVERFHTHADTDSD